MQVLRASMGTWNFFLRQLTKLFTYHFNYLSLPIIRKEPKEVDIVSSNKLKFFRWTRVFKLKKNKKAVNLDKLPILFVNCDEDAHCAICISDYEDNDLIRQISCSHHFHSDCVDEWFKLNSSCPLCKFDIVTKQFLYLF